MTNVSALCKCLSREIRYMDVARTSVCMSNGESGSMDGASTKAMTVLGMRLQRDLMRLVVDGYN